MNIDYLHEMGIQRWVRRGADAPAAQAGESHLAIEPAVQESSPAWSQLQETVSQCQRCELAATRTQTVFGSGNQTADWMFVGEAPGAEEDRQGYPFVGRAGTLLTAIVEAAGMRRDDIYIANVLKCRPPRNRDPMGEEVRQCSPYLQTQIELLQPKIIVALGAFAARALLQTADPIGRLRGRVHSYADTGIPLVATYHPAYLLRSPGEKPKVWEDIKLALARYRE